MSLIRIQMTSQILDLRIQWRPKRTGTRLMTSWKCSVTSWLDDRKDALRSTIVSLKKLMVKHWQQMAEANVEGGNEVYPQPQLCLPAPTSPH